MITLFTRARARVRRGEINNVTSLYFFRETPPSVLCDGEILSKIWNCPTEICYTGMTSRPKWDSYISPRTILRGGGRRRGIVKMDLPSLWYCLDGRDTAPEEGCIGGCCCVPLWGGPEELEVAELASVGGFLCSGVATWWPPPWYPKKSPKSGTHTLSYKFAGTFSREAFAASTSKCKTEINPQPSCTFVHLCAFAR